MQEARYQDFQSIRKWKVYCHSWIRPSLCGGAVPANFFAAQLLSKIILSGSDVQPVNEKREFGANEIETFAFVDSIIVDDP
jgi:hypothetical protein